MNQIYVYKRKDDTLWLKCIFLCIILLVISFASEQPQRIDPLSYNSSGNHFVSLSQMETPEFESDPRGECYLLERTAYTISESKSISYRTELTMTATAMLLTGILLLFSFRHSPGIHRSVMDRHISIISYIHAQDGLK